VRRLGAIVALALAACGEPVEAPPLGDYSAWTRFDIRGPAPGHGDSYRIIYANPVATEDAPFFGGYPEGSILVKEVHDDDGGQPGALRYVAIMRRVNAPPDYVVDEGGWLFSTSDAPGGDETHTDRCWRRCHVAAPYHGAWYDYRR